MKPTLLALFCAFGLAGSISASTNATVQANSGTNALPAKTSRSAPAVQAPSPGLPVPAVKKSPGYPFRGKLVSVNAPAGIIKIGKSTYYISPETKLMINGAQGRLVDFKPGQSVVGYARKAPDGRAFAVSLRIGEKPEAAGTSTKN